MTVVGQLEVKATENKGKPHETLAGGDPNVVQVGYKKTKKKTKKDIN